jgi:hypothetical protein
MSESSRIASPHIECRLLPVFEVADWNSVNVAFEGAARCDFAQSWLETPHPDFQPGSVRVGWRDRTLWVFAEMRDLDIYNEATQLNDPVYVMGDVFEMFLQCGRQKHYFELHVSPDNHRMQIRFDGNPRQFTAETLPFIEQHDLFFSRTEVCPEQEYWHVLAGIPAHVVEGEDCFSPGNSWRFSFGRYDYTRGHQAPVISSTSAHTIADFHQREEWGTLRFVE